MLTSAIEKCIIAQNRRNWQKSGKVFLDKTVKVFKETIIQPSSGTIKIGKNSCIRGILVNMDDGNKGGAIEIGENCYIGHDTRIWSLDRIKVGNNVLIAHNVNIFDNDTHPVDAMERREHAQNMIWGCGELKDYASLRRAPITIDDDSWIGCNSTILKGVTIGKGAIVAAGSVVTHDVKPWNTVAGNPARIISSNNRKEYR